MDHDIERVTDKKKKGLTVWSKIRYSKYRNQIIWSIALTSLGLLLWISYYLLMAFSDYASNYPLHLDSSSSNPQPGSYEEFVQQLVANHDNSNRIIEYPFQNPESHRKAINDRINQHSQYVLSHRPPIVPNPPDEKSLPYESLYNLIEKWNPDNPEPPSTFQEKIQTFNFGNPEERKIAEAYRAMEIPFKMFNVSEFNDASMLWDDAYLSKYIASMKSQGHVEKSNDNHFMFWSLRGGRPPKNYKSPTG
jgi:hypothetical protein